jgi:hypothetical protein
VVGGPAEDEGGSGSGSGSTSDGYGGWVGAPDPSKYAPGTTYLSPEQMEEEVGSGLRPVRRQGQG